MNMTHSQCGKLGGVATLRRHGATQMREWAKQGGRPLAQPPPEYKGYPFARGRDIGRTGNTSLFIQLPCARCQQVRWVRFIKEKPETSYCRSCAGFNAKWKGGRVVCSDGYVKIKLYPGDPHYDMAKADGYVFEHRLIMAQELKRNLHPWEAVHHKNGIKGDNRFENLELSTTKNHISDHNKGYSDGLAKGFRDGRSQRIKQLEAEIATLKAQIAIQKVQ